MKAHGKLTDHLEYVLEKDTLRKWKCFFETGKLHEPEMGEAPDEFLIDGDNLKFLQDTLKRENKDNWYAFYQAGIGAFSVEDFSCAESYLLQSWEKKHNPWACHGLACVCLLAGREKEAAEWMDKGLCIENRRKLMNCWRKKAVLSLTIFEKEKTQWRHFGVNYMKSYLEERNLFRTDMILKHFKTLKM